MKIIRIIIAGILSCSGLLLRAAAEPATIFDAIIRDDIAAVKRFIEQDPNVVRELDAYGATPLVNAIVDRNVPIVNVLIDNSTKEDLDLVDVDGNTAFLYAIHAASTDFLTQNKMVSVVRRLLQRNALCMEDDKLVPVYEIFKDSRNPKLRNIYNEAVAQRQKRIEALLHSTHKRTGAQSPMNVLPTYSIQDISRHIELPDMELPDLEEE